MQKKKIKENYFGGKGLCSKSFPSVVSQVPVSSFRRRGRRRHSFKCFSFHAVNCHWSDYPKGELGTCIQVPLKKKKRISSKSIWISRNQSCSFVKRILKIWLNQVKKPTETSLESNFVLVVSFFPALSLSLRLAAFSCQLNTVLKSLLILNVSLKSFCRRVSNWSNF